MPVLVTGASGFVGLGITEALLAGGDHVTAFDAAPLAPAAQAYLARLPGTLRLVTGDARDEAAVAAAMHGADEVVVAAAITAGPERELASPEAVVAVNVGAVATAVRLAAKAGVRRVVHLSSVSAYGATEATAGPLREDMPCHPQALYGITKLAGEGVALRLADLAGLDLVAVRLSSVFGPWEHATGLRDTLSPQLQITAAWRAGQPVVLDADAARDWLYVRDAAAAVLALLRAPALTHRLFNVGGGDPWPLSDWCRALDGAMAWEVGDTPTVRSWGARPSCSINRLLAETSFRPRFGPVAAAADWLAFLRAVGDDSMRPR